ncbi:hypothetical protein LOC67_03155 [Stieleria sp. JC731]|uniref:hypothetical protein n=1 Tax=Pirellulaceae TaxID=2691357 RepID=UPI001E2E3117|nr:hypothetical protein [Stieleria sp. JC731]MCC9599545.1 hypothetical protein [Stieleria sp. JC731]
MMYLKHSIALLSIVALVGCNGGSAKTEVDDSPIVMDELPPGLDSHDHGAHEHPEHGPHGGELVELGQEAYHIEFIHDDEDVEMFILDGAAESEVAIAAETLTVSLKLDGKVKSFELASVEKNADGKASHFLSTEADLVQSMKAAAEGVIVLNIEGKSFTGSLSHDHDHEGHDHSGHDH